MEGNSIKIVSCLPFEKGSTLKGKNSLPFFQKDDEIILVLL